jgi:hypothetical protein
VANRTRFCAPAGRSGPRETDRLGIGKDILEFAAAYFLLLVDPEIDLEQIPVVFQE